MKNYGLLFAVTSALLVTPTSAEETERTSCEVSSKPDFSAACRRISEQKCLEYNWERKNIEKCSTDQQNIEYPYMGVIGHKVMQMEGYIFMCSAVLISPRFALTSRRCILSDGYLTGPYIVRFGNKNIKDDVPRVDVAVVRTTGYPQPRGESWEKDLAILELGEELKLTRSVMPACLWLQSRIDVTDALSPGWTSTDSGDKALTFPSAMIKVRDLEILDKEDCDELYVHYASMKVDPNVNICTNGTEPKLCSGIPGNPLVTTKAVEGGGEMPHVLGVTSMALDCSGGSYRLFTKIPSYLDWIESVVWPAPAKPGH